jgi:hypothetical protein
MRPERLLEAIERAEPPAAVTEAALELLRELLDAPELPAAHWHPLGFLHLALLDAEPRRLRLHIWTQRSRREATAPCQVHDHVWRLTSHVLFGRLTNHLVEALPADPGTATHCEARVHYDGALNVLTPSDRLVVLSGVGTTRHLAGDRYDVAPHVLHETTVSWLPTATIVRSEVVHAGWPRTYLPAGSSAVRMRREPCAPADVVEAIRAVLDAAAWASSPASRTPVHCPVCSELMTYDNIGDLTCPSVGNWLSPHMQEILTRLAADEPANPPPTSPSFRWGRLWHCPADGSRMAPELAGMRCLRCGRQLTEGVLYELIEFNPHERPRY